MKTYDLAAIASRMALATLVLLLSPSAFAGSGVSAEYARQVSEGYAALPERFPGLMVVQTDNFASVGEAADRIAASVLATVRSAAD